MSILARLAVNGLGLWLAAQILPGVHWSGGIFYLLLAGAVVGLLNALVRPILVLLSLPLLLLTLGLFYFVLNGILIYLADWLLSGFRVDGFGWAMAAGLLLTALNLLLRWLDPSR